MGYPIRGEEAGAWWHVTSHAIDERRLFAAAEDFQRALDELDAACRAYALRVVAYSLMVNHFHLVLQTTRPNLGDSMQQFKSRYAKYYNAKYERRGPLYERRYWSRKLLSEAQVAIAQVYVERNAGRAGVVGDPATYPYCSLGALCGFGPPLRMLDVEAMLRPFGRTRDEAVTSLAELARSGLDVVPLRRAA